MGSMDWPWVEGKIEKIEAWITSLQSWGMFDRITVKRLDIVTGGTITADHGGLLGLGDDDHTIYLLASGTRDLTGNLTVSAGVTIDGVDISVHAATADAHHAGFIGLEDNAATAIVPAADDRIQLTDDGVINADASGSTIALSIAQAQIDHGTIGGLTDDDHGAVYPNFGDTETISGAWTFSNAIKIDRADDARILEIYEGATHKWDIYRDPYDRIVFWDAVNEENKFHFGQSNNILLINMADNDVFCQLTGTPGDIIWGVYNVPSNHGFIGSLGDIPFAIRQNNAAVIWIDADGKVGIGTSSPNETLEVNGNILVGGQYIRTEAGEGLFLDPASGQVALYDASANFYLDIYSGATCKVHLTSSGSSYLNGGNVGIGTTGPDAKLDVHGDTRLGDSDDGNYLGVSTTGVVTLHGTAKRSLNLRPDMDFAVVQAHGKPTQITHGAFSGYSLPIYAADNEELFFSMNVPGRWDGASDIIVHVLVALAGAETAGEDFNLQLSWENSDLGEPIVNTTHDVEVETELLAGRVAAYDTYQVNFTIDYDADGVGNEIEVHDLLAMRLRRIAVDGASDEVESKIIILDYHMNFTVDKMFRA